MPLLSAPKLGAALPPNLGALIEIAWPELQMRGYDTAKGADGMCGLATDEFWDIIDLVLPEVPAVEVHFTSHKRWLNGPIHCLNGEIHTYSYQHVPHAWYRNGCRHPGHVVPAVDGWLIDWTARQFDPLAPFPLIFNYAVVRENQSRLALAELNMHAVLV